MGRFSPKNDLLFFLGVSTTKASLPGNSFRLTEGVSRKPFPKIQTLENFFSVWPTPLTAQSKLLPLERVTLAIFLCAELGLRGLVV